MKKETLLTVSVIALLLLNFGTLGFLLLLRPPHPPMRPEHRLDQQIIEQLHLNAEQQAQFERLKSAHHEQMMVSDRIYREALTHYFGLLKNDGVVPAQRDSLQGILSAIQKERAAVTFQHFADLKALCGAGQQQNFDALLPDLLQVILPHDRKQKGGRH